MEAPIVQFTYAQFHLFYTIPLALVLWLTVRPFMDVTHWLNVLVLSIIALVYTTPWDNFLIATNTWTFLPDNIIMTIGWVPLEEYFFFIIQTLIVYLWTLLCLRWSLPCLHLVGGTPFRVKVIRWFPLPFIASATALSWTNFGAPETPWFYISCIVGWAFPVIGFLWIGAGNYFLKRLPLVLLAILLPTVYLAMVDVVALRADVWIINPRSVLGIYFYDDLPLEEVFFFLTVNVLLVLAYCAIEKSFAVLQNYPEEFQGNIFMKLFRAFFRLESSLDPERIEDLRLAIEVLRKASKSFWAASFIFPCGIRQDLCILYAFCRVTDDMVDDVTLRKEQKLEKLTLIRQFLNKLFRNRTLEKGQWKYALNMDPKSTEAPPSIDWSHYASILSREELAAFRALSRVAFQVPAEPFYELCRGYEWDILGNVMESEAQLIEYCACVASSVGVLCTFVMANERRDWFCGRMSQPRPDEQKTVEAARKMGLALQLTNVARDIVTDSESLGRCYIPAEFLETGQIKTFQSREPWNLGENKLKALAIRILDLADKNKNEAQVGIGLLPSQMRRPVIAATNIYSAIGKVIRQHPGYLRRASAQTTSKIGVLLKAIYSPTPAG